jgi:hypothetical protein
MNFATKGAAQPGTALPISLQTLDVRVRPTYGPREDVAPWAKTCLLVQPSDMIQTCPGLFAFAWTPNPGRPDSYSNYFGEALIFVSLEEGVWMIEVSFPETRKAPVVLGLGCSLVVTTSPQAAAELVALCFPVPVSPLQWLPYW